MASIPDGMALRSGGFTGGGCGGTSKCPAISVFFQRLRPWVVVPDWEGVAAVDW
jgi:hypothetical protein